MAYRYQKLLNQCAKFEKISALPPFEKTTYRQRVIRRINDYVMDLDAEGLSPPAEIERLLDKGRNLTKKEEDILVEWGESNIPGYYGTD